jgi:hypothetical protein
MTTSEPSLGEVPPPESPSGTALVRPVSTRDGDGPAGGQAAAGPAWIQRHLVAVGGVLLIAADLAWRAVLLGHLYFRQDDFENLNLAVRSGLSWHYLSYIGPGHFMMGQRFIAWVMTRGALYNWTLAVVVILALFVFAAVAGLRLLRTLFGERPAILILLFVYLLSPLTIPSAGFWSSATEELPTQAAIFMAVNAHVLYLRRGETRHLLAAVGWVAFGLIFYEKGLVLPFLLLAVTAAFFTRQRSWRAGIRAALVRYPKAWYSYAALLTVYAVLLVLSLHTTTAGPQTPHSLSAVATFVWGLLRNSLIPGTLGGPWQWLPITGGTYAIAAPPAGLSWLALIVAVALVGTSIVRRKIAWRAWVIWIGWVVVADMAPVIIRRINDFSPGLYALETRFVADAVAVLIICLGLAFLPLVPEHQASVPAVSWPPAEARSDGALAGRRLVAGVLAVFTLGSILSARIYYLHVSGSAVASYVGNAEEALRLVPQGTVTVNSVVPAFVVVDPVSHSLTSTVIGDIAPGRLRWVSAPGPTVDQFRIFGPDGRLYVADVQGASSPGGKPCFPVRHGRIAVNFWTPSPWYSDVLRIGYLWRRHAAGVVDVRYGSHTRVMNVKPGLHTGYLAVKGTANGIVLSSAAGTALCVGDAEAGLFAPDYNAPALPQSQGTGPPPA